MLYNANNVDSDSEITVGSGTVIDGAQVRLHALNTSTSRYTQFRSNLIGDEIASNISSLPINLISGVYSQAKAISEGGIPLPQAVAKNTLNYSTFININMRQDENTRGKATKITSRGGHLYLVADNRYLNVYSYAETLGKGMAGTSNANAWNDATLSNAVWIDDAQLEAYKNLYIIAENGGMNPNKVNNYNHGTTTGTEGLYEGYRRPVLTAKSKAKLKAIGQAAAHARITGTQINQIRSYDTTKVKRTSSNGHVLHVAGDPMLAIDARLEANASVPKIHGIKLGKTKEKEELIWYYFDRCDFCKLGAEYDVKPTEQKTLKERYKDAYERALLPIGDIERMIENIGAITRAHYGLMDDQTVASIYALDVQTILEKDVRLNAEKIETYKLWTNADTGHTTYLLPDATQLHMKGRKLDFVTTILKGDALRDGQERMISLYTAVTAGAYASGIIPIGSTGTLNFRTGMLTLPSHADYELYLHEVSGKWLTEQLESGMICRVTADQESLNACAKNGADLPETLNADGVTAGGEKNGWTIYWLGNTPETAADADETLLYLLVKPETDEVDAFRTSARMLANGDEPIDVSLYIFRDAKTDRMEEEQYDVFFFDTAEGEMSLVKVFTNTPGTEMQVPMSMEIKLRAFRVKDSDETAFSLYDQLLILCEVENGHATALGGFYTADFDSNRFENEYFVIEGMADGELSVTVKKGSPVWAEWTGEDSAVSLDGTSFKLIDGKWYEVSAS